MENAISEPVKLKASTEILDRAGVRGGIEFDTSVTVTDGRSPASIVADRLQRLANAAMHQASNLASNGVTIVDADVVEVQQKSLTEHTTEVEVEVTDE